MKSSYRSNEYVRLPTSSESDSGTETEATPTSEELQNGGDPLVRLRESEPGPFAPIPLKVPGPTLRGSSNDGSGFVLEETLNVNADGMLGDRRFSFKERLRIIATIPHVVALAALMLLMGYAAASIRAENARQHEAEDLEKRFAFVYLVTPNVTNVKDLGLSLQSLNKYFKLGLNYRVVIVHEGIPPLVQGRLQSLIEAPLRFREHQLRSPRSFNLSKETLSSTNETRWSYQKTIRFWFHTAVLAMPSKNGILADLDYIVRLNSDASFTRDISRDFIRAFVISGAQFGYQSIGKECTKNTTNGLKELAASYVELNGITPRSTSLWANVVRPSSGGCVPTFENHFEMINLRFFRSHSGIQDWLRVVDANGGIYRNGWGDAALRYITVALYVAPEKLIRYGFDVIPYKRRHQTITRN